MTVRLLKTLIWPGAAPSGLIALVAAILMLGSWLITSLLVERERRAAEVVESIQSARYFWEAGRAALNRLNRINSRLSGLEEKLAEIQGAENRRASAERIAKYQDSIPVYDPVVSEYPDRAYDLRLTNVDTWHDLAWHAARLQSFQLLLDPRLTDSTTVTGKAMNQIVNEWNSLVTTMRAYEEARDAAVRIQDDTRTQIDEAETARNKVEYDFLAKMHVNAMRYATLGRQIDEGFAELYAKAEGELSFRKVLAGLSRFVAIVLYVVGSGLAIISKWMEVNASPAREKS